MRCSRLLYYRFGNIQISPMAWLQSHSGHCHLALSRRHQHLVGEVEHDLSGIASLLCASLLCGRGESMCRLSACHRRSIVSVASTGPRTARRRGRAPWSNNEIVNHENINYSMKNTNRNSNRNSNSNSNNNMNVNGGAPGRTSRSARADNRSGAPLGRPDGSRSRGQRGPGGFEVKGPGVEGRVPSESLPAGGAAICSSHARLPASSRCPASVKVDQMLLCY